MLRRACPYAAHLPEDIFLNYVLHPRVNEEELSDCRRAMYDELSPLLAGLPEYQAAIRVNYWNASQVTYRLTDDRTISAAAAWRCGFGRCGEESTFAVNAYRAVGIPARVIKKITPEQLEHNRANAASYVEEGRAHAEAQKERT